MLTECSRVMVQGMTGHQGRFHTGEMLAFGTDIVAGVVPGKKGERVHGVPVFNTVKDAIDAVSPDTSAIFVPSPSAVDATMEAIDNGIDTILVVTEHIPVHDSIRMLEYARLKGTRIIGPNSPGVTIPGVGKLGIMPNMIFRGGRVGVVSRSGTLTYEVVNNLSRADIGQSMCIGIGGDAFVGTSFVDVLEMMENDDDTDAVVLIGEIGGAAEETAAEFILERMNKPIVAYIAGSSAPPDKRMGHAGALISGKRGTAQSKISALEDAGCKISLTPSEIPRMLKDLF